MTQRTTALAVQGQAIQEGDNAVPPAVLMEVSRLRRLALLFTGRGPCPWVRVEPELHRVGPEFASWPSGLTENFDQRLKVGPEFGSSPVHFSFGARVPRDR